MKCALCRQDGDCNWSYLVAWPGLRITNDNRKLGSGNMYWATPAGARKVCDECGPEEALRLWLLAGEFLDPR